MNLGFLHIKTKLKEMKSAQEVALQIADILRSDCDADVAIRLSDRLRAIGNEIKGIEEDEGFQACVPTCAITRCKEDGVRICAHCGKHFCKRHSKAVLDRKGGGCEIYSIYCNKCHRGGKFRRHSNHFKGE